MTFTEDDARACRDDFPALRRRVAGHRAAFLDGPAGTQVPERVIAAVSGVYRTANANTHGRFATSRETDEAMAAARAAAAAFLGAPDGATISFGANMTTLTFALAHALERELQPGDEIVITALDHEANRGPWLGLAQGGVVVREVGVTPEGRLDEDDFRAQVTERTRLVAMGMASNALGTVNDVGLARALADDVGARLLLDAVHHAPHFPMDVAATGADFVLCSAYKFYGPHVGILYCRPGLLDALEPDRLRTQDQAAPDRIETGTLDHAAIAGVTAAIEYIASWGGEGGEGDGLRGRVVSAMEAIGAYEHAVARRYAERVARISGVTVRGPGFGDGPRAPTVSITIDGVHPTEAAQALGERGIFVWDGHFYAARAMEALGLAERGGVIRAGVLMYNTPEEVDRLGVEVERLAG